MVRDATVTDSFSPSLVGPGASLAGSAVTEAEAAKTRKYATLVSTYNFSQLAFEIWADPVLSPRFWLLRWARLFKRLRTSLAQRLSLDVQRASAMSVLGTMTGWLEPA